MSPSAQPSRPLLYLLMLLTALGEISTQLLIPGLGALERDLQARPGASLLALSVFVAAVGGGQLFLGPLSDRIGRRPVLIGGVLTYLLATLWLFNAGSIEAVILARIFQGLGACAALVLARAIVRDVWREQAGAALSLTVIGMISAIVLSPMLGGWLVARGGWTAPVAATAGLGGLALLAVLVLYRETNPRLDPQAGRLRHLAGDYLDLLRGRGYRALALTLAFTYGGMFAVVAGSSAVYMGLLGLDAQHYGLTFGAVISGLFAGALFTQRMILRLGPQRIVAIGVSLVLAGALASVAVHELAGLSVLGLSLPQVLVTLGGGMVLPASVAGAVIPNAHRAGLAAGFMGFAQMAGATLSGLLLAALQDGSAQPMLYLQGVCAVAAFAAFHWLRRVPTATGLEVS